MKNFKSIFSLIVLVLSIVCIIRPAQAGLFSMDSAEHEQSLQDPNSMASEIPVFFNADKLIQKRQNEARELILEGRKLIQQGEKKKNEKLIAKGHIKKEIGEKQLEVLKEQIENRKNERNAF